MLIAIEGMEFYAYHGCYPEEQRIGGRYTTDVYITANIEEGAALDSLEHTLNYETIYHICKRVMKSPAHLIEHVAWQIGQQVCQMFTPSAQHILVRVRKHNPPIDGATIAQTFVEWTWTNS